VQGDVSIRRPDESDWTAATVNTPLEEGFSVATSANAFAEVEFENGSTARVGQGSQLDFTQLALTPQGDKINKLAVSKGYATFHFQPEHHDQYEVDAEGVTITSHGKTEFRTNFDGGALHVEVFDGEVQAAHDGKSEQVGKNRLLTYDPNASEAFNTTQGLQKDAWDKWTQARDQQAVLASNDSSVSANGALFGWNDLDTYGDWSFFPGYGYAWSPYEPAGWSPYSAGMWSFYPGWGFTWISGEPWGWMPFHNGLWNYDASMGWFWTPGAPEAWSPSLVTWYSGNGWVGWAPLGNNGASCQLATVGCLTAVPPSVLEQGTTLRMGSPLVIHPPVGSTVQRTGAPSLVDTRTGRPVSGVVPQNSVARTAPSPAVSAAPAIHAAPSSVVMGREVAPDAFLTHHGFLSAPQPIHAQLGRTMGGTIPTVVNRGGEVMPDPKFHGAVPQASGPSNAGPAMQRVPMMMAHGAPGGGAPAAQLGAHGGVTPVATASTAQGGAPGVGAEASSNTQANAPTSLGSSNAGAAPRGAASAPAASAPSAAGHR
jgi:FecR protein